MKKELKMLCMAMIASILTTGFCACSNDDDDNETNSGVGKGHWVLTRMQSDNALVRFSYDEQGRIVYDTAEGLERTYEYQTGKIVTHDSYGTKTMFLNKDGLIERIEGDEYTECIQYENGYVSSYQYDRIQSFAWDRGLCTAISYNNTINVTYSYGNSSINEDCIKALNAQILGACGFDDYHALLMTGYLGKLPSKFIISEHRDSEEQDMTYELKNIDDNGCPGTMIRHVLYKDGYKYDREYHLYWAKI